MKNIGYFELLINKKKLLFSVRVGAVKSDVRRGAVPQLIGGDSG